MRGLGIGLAIGALLGSVAAPGAGAAVPATANGPSVEAIVTYDKKPGAAERLAVMASAARCDTATP